MTNCPHKTRRQRNPALRLVLLKTADCRRGAGRSMQIFKFFSFSAAPHPRQRNIPSGHRSLSSRQSRQAHFTTPWLHPTFPVNSARHQPNGLTAEQGAEQRRLCKSTLDAFQQLQKLCMPVEFHCVSCIWIQFSYMHSVSSDLFKYSRLRWKKYIRLHTLRRKNTYLYLLQPQLAIFSNSPKKKTIHSWSMSQYPSSVSCQFDKSASFLMKKNVCVVCRIVDDEMDEQHHNFTDSLINPSELHQCLQVCFVPVSLVMRLWIHSLAFPNDTWWKTLMSRERLGLI